jgi:hypothetical protein
MATGRGSSGDGEKKRAVKDRQKQNSKTGWSPGRRSVMPEGMNKSKASKDPAMPAIRKPIGLK